MASRSQAPLPEGRDERFPFPHRQGARRDAWSGLLALTLGGLSVSAAVPTLDHLFPAAVQAGTTRRVAGVGKWDPWPPRVWVGGEGLRVEPTSESGTFEVVAATNAVPGPRFVRVFNDDGTSAPRFLIVSGTPQTDEVEPNDALGKAQPVGALPASIQGRLGKSGDVDSFAVTVAAGQTLVAAVEAHTLMSPVDAVLRLVDARGVTLALNHDDGRTLDPFLAWTAPVAGTCVVQVFGFAHPADSDIRFTGNPKCVYRLHLTTGPALRQVRPLGVQRGAVTPLAFVGWNLGGGPPPAFPFDAVGLGGGLSRVVLQPPGFAIPFELAVGEGPELPESEPNDLASTARALPVPGAVTGDLSLAGDEDRYSFPVKKGDRLSLEVKAASLGFPLDAWLKVEDPAGKELARNDDADGADPRLDWTAPADGSFVAAVGNLLHRGGEDLLYRLEVRRAVPSVKASVVENAFTVASGATHEIKVSLQRRFGFESRVTLAAVDLPEGVTALPVEVGPKESEGVLKLVAAAGAKAFGGPFRIRVGGEGVAPESWVGMELVTSGENNGVPQGFRRLVLESIDRLWLTVTVPPKKAEPEKAK